MLVLFFPEDIVAFQGDISYKCNIVLYVTFLQSAVVFFLLGYIADMQFPTTHVLMHSQRMIAQDFSHIIVSKVFP